MEIGKREVTGEDKMTEVVIEDAVSDIEEVEKETVEQAQNPATFQGNAYDITSLIALISGIGILFLCLTCNMGYNVLPIVAVILGIVGVVMAKKSVNPSRTQLLSWLGIGGGLAFILISIIGITLYIILLIVVLRTTGPPQF